MAVKNGSQFILEQIQSILPQLAGEDELIVSDDHSTDSTVKIIEQIRDKRIRVLKNPRRGLIQNFENALNACRGTFIFLADQDDVWKSDKIERMKKFLHAYDVVVCDCEIVDEYLQSSQNSFFHLNRSRSGLFRNLIRNSYMGCCMAFHRKVLSKALPFPSGLRVHDGWIGLVGEMYFTKIFIPDKLVYHRKHNGNASSTAGKSVFSTLSKISHRMKLVKGLIEVHYAR